jgi:hypothetical protein
MYLNVAGGHQAALRCSAKIRALRCFAAQISAA